MKMRAFVLPMLMLVVPFAVAFASAASAQDRPVATEASALPKACVLTPDGCVKTSKYKHRLSFPAGALSHTPGFTMHPRGLNWPQPAGYVSLTLRRPLDVAAGAKVRVTVVYEVYGGGDGDIVLQLTPIAFHHLSGFETYGSVAFESLVASSGNLMEQSIEVPSGFGFSPGGDWWYFEIGRAGSFPDGIRVMAVAIDY